MGHEIFSFLHRRQSGGHDLVDDIKVVLERRSRYEAKVVAQNLYKRLQERKGE